MSLFFNPSGLTIPEGLFFNTKLRLKMKTEATYTKESFRANDVIARIGGDEFAVLLPKTPPVLIEQAVTRIETEIQKYNDYGVGVQLSMSIGYG